MYERKTQEDRDQLYRIYLHDDLFQVLLIYLSSWHRKMHDLSPVEVWSEALRVIHSIAVSPARELTSRTLYDQLVDQYREYIDERGEKMPLRSEEEAEVTASTILLTVVYMMNSGVLSLEEHPYYSLANELVKTLQNHTDLFVNLEEIATEEDRYEKEKGHELPLKDYLLDSLASSANLQVNSDFAKYILQKEEKVLAVLMMVAKSGDAKMPSLIKYIKALQSIDLFDKNCFNNIDEFINACKSQFPDLNFDKSNVNKQVEKGENARFNNDEINHIKSIEHIATYLRLVLE